MELNILQPEQSQSQIERRQLQCWIGTSERQQQEQDVKIQICELNVHDEIIHIDIIFNGEITIDLTQVVYQQQDDKNKRQ